MCRTEFALAESPRSLHSARPVNADLPEEETVIAEPPLPAATANRFSASELDDPETVALSSQNLTSSGASEAQEHPDTPMSDEPAPLLPAKSKPYRLLKEQFRDMRMFEDEVNSDVPQSAQTEEPSLPVGSEIWTKFEVDLFLMSKGVYNPQDMALHRRICNTKLAEKFGTGSRLAVTGRVSIVAPTMSSRQQYHESLWACFDAQTSPDKELVVVETYTDFPSTFLQSKAEEDSRFVHVAIRRELGQDFSVGLKRNMTLHLASGEYIVNFDDDDIYAATYAETMVGEMKLRDLHGITLSSWHNFYRETGVCTYSDPSSWDEWTDDSKDKLDGILYGYGFSYAHKRYVALEYPYPDVGFAEDAPFFLKLKEIMGEDKVALKQDQDGICMHIMHKANSAQVLGSQKVDPEMVRSLAVADLPCFQDYLNTCSRSCDPLTKVFSVFETLGGMELFVKIAGLKSQIK